MDKYISPQRVIMMEDLKGGSGKLRAVEIGYGTGGLRIGVLDDAGYHVITLPVDRASLLIEAITLAAAEYREAEKEAGK